MNRTMIAALMLIGSACFVPARAQTQMKQDGTATADDAKMQKLAPTYEKFANASTGKLISKDADGFIAMMDPDMVKKIGSEKFKNMVNRVFVPFFSDYEKNGDTLKLCLAQGQNGEKGLSLYPEFITSSGVKKHYVVTIMDRNGSPVIAALLPNVTFEQEHPNVEAERKKLQH